MQSSQILDRFTEATAITRRHLFRVVGTSAGALLLLKALPGCGAATGSAPTGTANAGNVSGLNVGSLHTLPSNLIVARDGNGVYAMSGVCTHQGGILQDGNQSISVGLHCPVHGAGFDGNGNVTNGPARTPLQHYQVAIAADGTITVNADQSVASSVRTPVP